MSAGERGVPIIPLAMVQAEGSIHLDPFELRAQGEARTREVRSR